MSIFSRLFRDRKQRHFKEMTEKIIERNVKRTEKETKPLAELGLAIVRAATNCRECILPLIQVQEEKARQLAEIYASYEFIYFFVHQTMRVASGIMSEREIKHLQEQLGPLLATTAIDSYCKHWRKEIKIGLVPEFYDKLNAAELEYAKCSQFDSPAPSEARSLEILQALCMLMGSRVAAIIGQGQNPAVPLEISKVALSEFSRISWIKLIDDFKQHSMGLPPPTHLFWQ
jgi:hypothetical protein